MHLEMGTIPVKFVMMEKRLNFLKYILNENMNSMIRQVFEVIKTDSRKGDFYYLVKQDMSDLEIEIPEEDIIKMNKLHWKKFIHRTVKEASLKTLLEENETK